MVDVLRFDVVLDQSSVEELMQVIYFMYVVALIQIEKS